MNKNNTIGFSGLLGIAFIVLKLCKVIDWSWWWVLSPFWIPIALVGLFLGGLYLFLGSRKLFVYLFMKEKYYKEKERMQQMKSIVEKKKGKSKWQLRIEEIQENQKKVQALKDKKTII